MNDIMTDLRASMSQQNLKNPMLWHSLATKLDADGKRIQMKCRDVPVMAILKEYRTMAGIQGRKNHTPQPIPKYEYEKHRESIKVEKGDEAGGPSGS